MAVQCAGVLAKALRGAWRPYMKGLVEPMILTGLSETLTKSFKVRTSDLRKLLWQWWQQFLKFPRWT